MFSIGSKEDNKNYELDLKGVNNLRGLALDMIVNAGSGHGGIILSAAPIIYTLYKYHMNLDFNNLNYINRDRFILSAGHSVPLLYGIDYFLELLELDDLKKLRKIDSKTPGHPELGITPLVEFTSGALGQGVGTSVGCAIASKYLKEKTNNLINNYTYVLCGDGELEEGITYESLAIAGTLKLNNLIVLVDCNNVTLDSNLNDSSCENLKMRFEAINFNVIECDDSVKNINESLELAHKSDKPTVILVKTIMGLYSKYEGTNKAHGMVPDSEDLLNIKEKLEIHEASFTVNNEVISEFKKEVEERSNKHLKEFNNKYQELEDKSLVDKLINHEVSYNLNEIDIFSEEKSLRENSKDLLNKIANDFELLIGGSCDLSSSCKTYLENLGDFKENNYKGRNIYFGIREHAAGAITNGMALSGLRPFVSTFLAFSDYMRASIRESAIMKLPVLYIFTHDSITVGPDGPLHHPIEQLPSLELIPNLKVYRPFDLNELIGSYIDIFKNNNPACLVLPRDSKNISAYTKSSEVANGIYEVIRNDTDDFINLIANGEELGIVLKVSKNLKEMGIDNKVLSIPCKKNVSNIKDLLNNQRTIAITLANPVYFYDITNEVIGINDFGKSGSKEELLDFFGFSEEKLVTQILELLKK
ncbi:MAG: transketolase [Bacilli bacterium]|nr:transketolase [Bacilli bacterium]